jgi:hypothetical protein
MMMESESMVVDGDVGGDEGGEDLEIPLFSVESRINVTSETKIMDVAVLCFAKSFVLLDR